MLLLSTATIAGAAVRSLPLHPDLANLHELTPTLLSGGEPKSPAAFAHLASLGVRTLISVDGARPDIDAAAAAGLRYVHVPIGYATVTVEAQLQIARALEQLPGPAYLHCHHGHHRGPAAAAAALIVHGDWTTEQGTAALHTLGTSPNYTGLYAAVAAAMPTTSEELKQPQSFPAQVPVSDTATAMASIDRHWDHLKAAQAIRWLADPNHPDITPAHEALQIREQLVELGRSEKNAELAAAFTRSAQRLAELEAALRSDDAAAADAHYQQIRRDCRRCHQHHRDE